MNSIKIKYFLATGLCFFAAILANGQPTDGPDVMVGTNSNPKYEVHLSIDETAPANILLSTNTQVYSGQNLNPHQGVYSSSNSGTSFSGVDTYPNCSCVSRKGDPCTGWDFNGNGYVSSLDDFFSGVKLIKTTNKGVSWSTPVTVCVPSLIGHCGNAPINNKIDKPWITVDNAVNSMYQNNIYSVWTEFTTDYNCHPYSTAFIGFCKSTNGGTSFSTPIQVRDDVGKGHGSQVATGPNGEVYVCWAEFGSPTSEPAQSIGFAYSANGGSTFATSTKNAFSYVGINDPLVGNGAFGNVDVNDFPSMAVDKSCGPYSGRIYIAYPENISSPGSMQAVIKVKYSDNNGATWQSAFSGNAVSIANSDQNFFPAISVDNYTGIVSVAYYSFDDISVYAKTNTYMAYSKDGGTTFSNIKVSDVSHITAPIPGLTNYAGDYIGVTSYNAKVYVSWMDNRTGSTMADWQTYVSKVDFGSVTTYSTLPIVLNVNGPITIPNGTSRTYKAVDKVIIPASSTFQSNAVSTVNILACKEVNLANNFSAANELHAYIMCPIDPCFVRIVGGRYTDEGGTVEEGQIAADIKPDMFVNLQNLQVQMFPNPTSGVLQLSVQAPDNCVATARIYDISGGEVSGVTYSIRKGDNTLKLDLSNYTPGIYFIAVINEAGIVVKRTKVVLQN